MFANMKVGTKLIAGFLCLVLFGAIVAIVGIVNMGRVNDLANKMYEHELVGLSHIKEARINLAFPRHDGHFR